MPDRTKLKLAVQQRFTQDALAARLKLTPSRVSQILNGDGGGPKVLRHIRAIGSGSVSGIGFSGANIGISGGGR